MPPILTGNRPLPENAVINAPVRSIVKWLNRENGGGKPRIRAELAERCLQFFCALK
jgi:hypothetical protein